MRTVEVKVYKYGELSDEAKEKALEWAREHIACYPDWWDSTFEDAHQIGLKLKSFDLDRNRHAKGEFVLAPEDCAKKILAEHGEQCETHKTAKGFLQDLATLRGLEENHSDFEGALEDLEGNFLHSLLEDYSLMLQRESDHMYEEEYLAEHMEANNHEFTEDGDAFLGLRRS